MSRSYVAHVLAPLFGVCATCADLYATWYVSDRPGSNVHALIVRNGCIARQRASVPCNTLRP